LKSHCWKEALTQSSTNSRRDIFIFFDCFGFMDWVGWTLAAYPDRLKQRCVLYGALINKEECLFNVANLSALLLVLSLYGTYRTIFCRPDPTVLSVHSPFSAPGKARLVIEMENLDRSLVDIRVAGSLSMTLGRTSNDAPPCTDSSATFAVGFLYLNNTCFAEKCNQTVSFVLSLFS
jgi:hypothetical protein